MPSVSSSDSCSLGPFEPPMLGHLDPPCSSKALAHDQLRSLRTLCAAGATQLFGLRVDTYDGDTPQQVPGQQ